MKLSNLGSRDPNPSVNDTTRPLDNYLRRQFLSSAMALAINGGPVAIMPTVQFRFGARYRNIQLDGAILRDAAARAELAGRILPGLAACYRAHALGIFEEVNLYLKVSILAADSAQSLVAEMGRDATGLVHIGSFMPMT